MSISEKNMSILLIVAFVLVIVAIAVVMTTTTFSGELPGLFDTYLDAHCAGSTCGTG